MTAFKLVCVLFDLDGTLVDTAPDLLASLNRSLTVHGYPQIAAGHVRPLISHGAMAMLDHAAADADAGLKQQMLDYMLDYYLHNIAEHSRIYAGMDEILRSIEEQGLKWGVVTNKRQRFTRPLLDALDLSRRAACIVSGDTTANSKPHPEPMLAACRQAGVLPENCVFIGDAAHDITAGRDVGMKTLAALYGYLQAGDQPQNWGADAVIEHPRQLQQWIQLALCH
ncbi:MAG: HAD-IA family hydrolase [Methylococcales bacterium]|nr:HAD-IA family hydrolase [Methylococcales bacterium]